VLAEQECAHFDATQSNPGLWLGLALGELARHGRDKLTFVVGDPVPSFGLWVEQLVAESTGKHGRGILPVADEPLLAPEAYGNDRVFIQLRDETRPDASIDERVGALAAAGHPTLTLNVSVAEAKQATKRVLGAGGEPEIASAGPDALKRLLGSASEGGFIAVMGYVAPSVEFDEAVHELRATLMEKTKLATTFGYGPRFLHSTGQLHKGGAPIGRFLSLICDSGDDVAIPGERFGFRTLKNAQALGDLETLRSHELPAEIVRLEGDPADALRKLHTQIKEML
jgi:hypothetical protein